MFQNNYPVFAQGVVLKAAMLESVSTYQRNMLDMIYGDCSEGIVTGVEIGIQDGTTITVSPGIVKFGGMLYHMYVEAKIMAYPAAEPQYLRIRFLEKKEKSDEVQWKSEFILDTEEPDHKTELELCRFVLSNGAVLRNSYTDLKDYSTIHNTVNIIETPYSARDRSTFSPKFLMEYGHELLSYNLTNPYDISFAMECIKGQNISREIIELYICKRLELPAKSFSNQEIYKNLLSVLDKAKRGENGTGRTGGMGVRRMIVD